jgi:hypothetical protein
MARSRAVRGQAGFVTTPVTLAVAGVLALTLCGLVWFALHPPQASQIPKLVLPATPAAGGAAGTGTGTKANGAEQNVPPSVHDSNARMRLRYAWLAATDWARDHHQSFSGLSPETARRLLQRSGVEATLPGEKQVVLTKFDRARRATWGAVSIRVANGEDLLLVTRSQSGRAFCFVQMGRTTGIGPGDAHGLGACSVRWG